MDARQRTPEPWRSGVSAERRWLLFQRIAALCRDAATRRRFMSSFHDLTIAHPNREPVGTNFCCICDKRLDRRLMGSRLTAASRAAALVLLFSLFSAPGIVSAAAPTLD